MHLIALSDQCTHLSAYISASTTGRTSVKFNSTGLLWKSVQKIQIWLKLCTLHEDSLIVAGDIKFPWKRLSVCQNTTLYTNILLLPGCSFKHGKFYVCYKSWDQRVENILNTWWPDKYSSHQWKVEQYILAPKPTPLRLSGKPITS
jgi:hypothetical protein